MADHSLLTNDASPAKLDETFEAVALHDFESRVIYGPNAGEVLFQPLCVKQNELIYVNEAASSNPHFVWAMRAPQPG